MARIFPETFESAPEQSRPTMEALKKKLGMLPNLFATIAKSPASLNFVVGSMQTLAGGKLSGREIEIVNLLTSEMNGCAYCVAAHATLGRSVGLGPDDVAAVREGRVSSQREQAIVALTRRVVRTGGAGAGTELARAREAGLTDGEIIEVIAHVSLKAFTNAVAILAETEIDFPKPPGLPSK
jgi:uncharacterized peroxidase-related enzyme